MNDIRSEGVFDSWGDYNKVMVGQAVAFFLITLAIDKLKYSQKVPSSAQLNTRRTDSS